MNRLILNSKGLNTKVGTAQIKQELTRQGIADLSDQHIYIVSFPEYEVDEIILNNCLDMGFLRENIVFSDNHLPDYQYRPDIVYVTEGNTFEVLDYMRRLGIDNYIKALFGDEGKQIIYIGSSAGAAIAGDDIRLSLDFNSNFVRMYDFRALGLFQGAILPHHTKEQKEKYIGTLEEHLIQRYKVVYSVSNEETLVLNVHF